MNKQGEKSNNKNSKHFFTRVTLVFICFFATMTLWFYPSYTKVTASVSENVSLIGDGTAEDPYKIATADDLITFSAMINSGAENGHAVLTSDIVFNAEVIKNDGQVSDDLQSFTPIGNKDNIFKCVFDGQDFTISGLYFSDETASYAGLFGRISSGAVIKNLKVKDSYFSARDFVGGIVGDNGGAVENCIFDGKATAAFEGLGGIAGANFGVISDSCNYSFVEGGECVTVENYTVKDSNGKVVTNTITKNCKCEAVGGVAGANYGTIKNSRNYGKVRGGSNIGGITGLNNGVIKDAFNTGDVTCETNSSYAYLGGAVGYNTTLGSVENVYNTGNVFTNRYYVGGIMGFTESGKPIYIKNCYNTGDVTGGMYVGGIIGYNQIAVENCYNVGSVVGPRYVGGVAGYSRQRKNTSASIVNCYNTGEITDNGTWHIDIGSIIGYNNGGKIENCYYLYNSGGITDSNQGAIKTNDSDFKSGRIAYLLNGSKVVGVWRQNLDGEHYPDFTSRYVYYNNESQGFYNHVHNVTVTLQDNVICARCDLVDCVQSDRGSVTVLLPTGFVYDGGEKVVTVINELKDGVSVSVNYTSADYELNLNEKPIKVGEYTASITVFDSTFDFNFEIISAAVDGVDFSTVEKSATIYESTVEFKDKITLVSAKESLGTVLNDYRDNYKPSLLVRYETIYKQVNLSLKTLANAEKVLESIAALPNEITVEDKNDVEQAKIAYENLLSYEKRLVDEDNYNKLQKSISDLEKAIQEKENAQNSNAQNGISSRIVAIVLGLIGVIVFILSFLF